MKKKSIMAVMVLFYAAMALLALTAKRRYLAGLPHVKVMMLKPESFVDEEGNYQTSYALPKKCCINGAIYYIEEAYKNGETRTVVRQMEPELGQEKEDMYQMLSGWFFGGKVVYQWNKPLADGCEVYVE